jgi:hypothetical protein
LVKGYSAEYTAALFIGDFFPDGRRDRIVQPLASIVYEVGFVWLGLGKKHNSSDHHLEIECWGHHRTEVRSLRNLTCSSSSTSWVLDGY